MPRTIVFDALTNVSITVKKDMTGGEDHQIIVAYSWLATDGEVREQADLNIYPWLLQNNPTALATISSFFDAVVDAVKERDGLA